MPASEGKMNQNWNSVFAGTIESRPVKLLVWDDGESQSYRVETNYNRDQFIGDAPGVIGVPVSADDIMHIDGETADELQGLLVTHGEFSQHAAAELVSHVRAANK